MAKMKFGKDKVRDKHERGETKEFERGEMEGAAEGPEPDESYDMGMEHQNPVSANSGLGGLKSKMKKSAGVRKPLFGHGR